MNVEHLSENFHVPAVLKYGKESWVNHNLNRYYLKLDEAGRKTALELVYDKCVAAQKEAEKPKPKAEEKPAKPASNKPARTQKPEQKVTANPGGEEDATKEQTT